MPPELATLEPPRYATPPSTNTMSPELSHALEDVFAPALAAAGSRPGGPDIRLAREGECYEF